MPNNKNNNLWKLIEDPGVNEKDFKDAQIPNAPLPYILPSTVLWWRMLPLLWLVIAWLFLNNLFVAVADYWLLESIGHGEVFWINLNMILKLTIPTFIIFAGLTILPAYLYAIDKQTRKFLIHLGILIGLIAAYSISDYYLQFLMLQGSSFDIKDPIFNNDISFYVFTLPNIWTVWTYAFIAFLISSVISIWCAYHTCKEKFKKHLWSIIGVVGTPYTRFTLIVCGLLLALNTWLRRYDVLWKDNSDSSIPTGAEYIDVNGLFSTVNFLWFVAFILVITTILLVQLLKDMNHTVTTTGTMAWTRKTKILGWLVLIIFTIDLTDVSYTGLIWMRDIVSVRPNEPVIQLDYIQKHIDATRTAYNLDEVEEIEFLPNRGEDPLPDLAALLASPEVKNASLWPGFSSYLEKLLDPQHAERPLLSDFRKGNPLVYGPTREVFEAQQRLRSYYNFLSVNNLRLNYAGEKHMLVSSVREIPLSAPLPWLTAFGQQYMHYTHGYGLVSAYSGQIDSSGFPVYTSSGIPIESKFPQLELKNPRVFYGEDSSSMAISNIKDIPGFDFPTDDDRALYKPSPEDKIGVPLDSLSKRFVFGWLSGNLFNFIFSQQITDETILHYKRTPSERLETIAPFLVYDMNKAAIPGDETIKWLINGLTTTDRYPYSNPVKIGDKSVSRIPKPVEPTVANYIEDSVKAIVNAYSGEVTLYKFGEGPIIDTWAAVYPNLFTSKKDMSSTVRSHITYPSQYYHHQFDDIYQYYQMQDAMHYFTKEDIWDDADEVLGEMLASGRAVTFSIEPYNSIINTRNNVWPTANEEVQFATKGVFTPEGPVNLRAITSVYHDADDYGKLSVLKVPKGEYVLGPEQANALVDQDAEIAREFGYWERTGSTIIRGHTTTIIFDNELIYVEPVFLSSKQKAAPALKKVIVVMRDQVFMGDNLQDALENAYAVLD